MVKPECGDDGTGGYLRPSQNASLTIDLSALEEEFVQPSNCASMHIPRRSVGPVANPDEKNGHPVFWIIRRDRWRPREICSPALSGVTGNKPHHVWMPAFIVVA